MERRQFIRSAAVTVGALASGIESGVGIAEDSLAGQTASEKPVAGNNRNVRVVSIGFEHKLSLERIAELVNHEGAKGADLIALPEFCRGHAGAVHQETLNGPTISAMAQLARKHRTYIVCPIDRKDGDLRFNSAVLLDRRGQIAGVYDKMYPVYEDECLWKPPIQPGEAARVFPTDFGRIGIAICFDVNWTPVWRQMANLGAELVIFPSEMSAGRCLQARAIQYNYYIVSSTTIPDCLIYDIDGDLLAHDHENFGKGINITRATLDMDRCIVYTYRANEAKLKVLLQEHPDDIEVEKDLDKETAWMILRAKRPGVSARALARQYGVEELRHYINRSRCEIDKCRGWEFS
jgi:predicted amidohydrolase